MGKPRVFLFHEPTASVMKAFLEGVALTPKGARWLLISLRYKRAMLLRLADEADRSYQTGYLVTPSKILARLNRRMAEMLDGPIANAERAERGYADA